MLTASELEKLGLEAANQAAGPGAVEKVEVASGEDDLDRPTYLFSFLIDQANARQRAGVLRIRLIQSLRDALIAHGDGHVPIIRILDRADWERRSVA